MCKSATSPRLQHAQYTKGKRTRNINEFEATYGANAQCAQCFKGGRLKAWANARTVKFDTNPTPAMHMTAATRLKTARRRLKAKRRRKAWGEPRRKQVINV